MFNVGGGEFLIILLVALVVLGPTKLPEAARQVGKMVGEFRRLSSGFQAEMRSALDDPVSKVTGEATPKTFADVTKVAEAGPLPDSEPATASTPRSDPFGGSTQSSSAPEPPAEDAPPSVQDSDPSTADDGATASANATPPDVGDPPPTDLGRDDGPEIPMFGDR